MRRLQSNTSFFRTAICVWRRRPDGEPPCFCIQDRPCRQAGLLGPIRSLTTRTRGYGPKLGGRRNRCRRQTDGKPAGTFAPNHFKITSGLEGCCQLAARLVAGQTSCSRPSLPGDQAPVPVTEAVSTLTPTPIVLETATLRRYRPLEVAGLARTSASTSKEARPMVEWMIPALSVRY